MTVTSRFGPPAAAVLGLLALWEAAVRVANADPILLPGPARILQALWEFRDDALRHLVPTLVETLVGLAISLAIAIASLDGFRSAPAEASDLLRSYGAGEGQTFRLLRWPVALPALFTGLRIAAVYAVIGAVFGEYVGATDGLGIWMQLSQNAFRTDLVFAAILLSALISISLHGLVVVAERLLIPWHAASRRGGQS